jgi:hypothetical protein
MSYISPYFPNDLLSSSLLSTFKVNYRDKLRQNWNCNLTYLTLWLKANPKPLFIEYIINKVYEDDLFKYKCRCSGIIKYGRSKNILFNL